MVLAAEERTLSKADFFFREPEEDLEEVVERERSFSFSFRATSYSASLASFSACFLAA